MVFLAIAALVFITYAENIVPIFTPRSGGFTACGYVRVFSIYRSISNVNGTVAGQAFNGAGGTFTPTPLNLICFWLRQMPLPWFLAIVLKMGPKGAFLSGEIPDTLLAGLGILWFRRETWKNQRVCP